MFLRSKSSTVPSRQALNKWPHISRQQGFFYGVWGVASLNKSCYSDNPSPLHATGTISGKDDCGVGLRKRLFLFFWGGGCRFAALPEPGPSPAPCSGQCWPADGASPRRTLPRNVVWLVMLMRVSSYTMRMEIRWPARSRLTPAV